MIKRFHGQGGEALLTTEIARQRICFGCPDAAKDFVIRGRLHPIKTGEFLIRQGEFESEVHLIIAGGFRINVNGRFIAERGPGEHVGEMAGITPISARSADVIAVEDGLVLSLNAPDFLAIANTHPAIWQNVTRELIRRLDQRSQQIKRPNQEPRVFIISSSEALPVAQALVREISGDPLTIVLWTDNVFQMGDYTLESLEHELQSADFAIAIVSADDVTISRRKSTNAPRDNVIFELGYFMGRLGRHRAMLMFPSGAKIKLPSDFFGLTGKPYKFIEPGGGLDFAAACKALREHVLKLGPF